MKIDFEGGILKRLYYLFFIIILFVILGGCSDKKIVKVKYGVSSAQSWPTYSALGNVYYPVRFDVSGRKNSLLITLTTSYTGAFTGEVYDAMGGFPDSFGNYTKLLNNDILDKIELGSATLDMLDATIPLFEDFSIEEQKEIINKSGDVQAIRVQPNKNIYTNEFRLAGNFLNHVLGKYECNFLDKNGNSILKEEILIGSTEYLLSPKVCYIDVYSHIPKGYESYIKVMTKGKIMYENAHEVNLNSQNLEAPNTGNSSQVQKGLISFEINNNPENTHIKLNSIDTNNGAKRLIIDCKNINKLFNSGITNIANDYMFDVPSRFNFSNDFTKVTIRHGDETEGSQVGYIDLTTGKFIDVSVLVAGQEDFSSSLIEHYGPRFYGNDFIFYDKNKEKFMKVPLNNLSKSEVKEFIESTDVFNFSTYYNNVTEKNNPYQISLEKLNEILPENDRDNIPLIQSSDGSEILFKSTLEKENHSSVNDTRDFKLYRISLGEDEPVELKKYTFPTSSNVTEYFIQWEK